MPPKKEYWTIVATEEQFMTYFNPENKKLVVCDVYPSWSGPCDMLFPQHKNLALNIDDFDKRVDIILVDQDILVEYKNDKLREPSCRPKLLFFMEGKIIDEVVGANIPQLVEKVSHLNITYYAACLGLLVQNIVDNMRKLRQNDEFLERKLSVKIIEEKVMRLW